MAASAEKIKELLGNGLSNDVVATAVGCSPSYISQLMSDEQFSAEVITMRTQVLSAATVRDRGWDSLEDKLLTHLHEQIDLKMIYKPNDVLRALMVANKATRRGTSAQENLVVHQNIVTLNLPTVVTRAYKTTISGEVVEVTKEDGSQQTLVTMPAASLMRQLAERNGEGSKYETVRKYLPGGGEKENT